ncbi:MAG: hypothetical protein HY064_00980 [Bacteroidetes bacterium]|nr:hypothetical protein [Bacteroidota bacterium]
MKKISFISAIIILSTGCNSFFHERYSSLKKIPAHGIPSEEKCAAIRKNDPDTQAALVAAQNENLYANEIVLPAKPACFSGNDSISHLMRGEKKISSFLHAGVLRKNFPFKKNFRKGDPPNDHSAIIILGMIIVGLFLMGYGGGILVVGILAPSALLILLGAAMLFLGIIPFLGLISMIAGDPYKDGPKKFQEKKR